MAEIVENLYGRRMIRISTDDIISLVKEYQNTVCGVTSYEKMRDLLNKREFFLPEDV